MSNLVDFVNSEFVTKKDFPVFGAGDTITVYYEIKEGEKTRTQFFKGVVIQRRGSGNTETFTIRKMSKKEDTKTNLYFLKYKKPQHCCGFFY